jgi:hypothetical protein
MTGDSTIFTLPTPSKFVTVVPNALISLLLRSPLHGIVSKSCILLSFRGRKSGNRYTFPVGYWKHEGDTVETIPLHNWWKNLRGNAPVTLWLKGRRYSAIADAFQGDDTTVNELQSLVQASSALIRVCRVERDAQGQPRPESLRQVARSLVLIRLRLTEPT